MVQFPEGIRVWDWLLNSDGIRFKGAFFYWIFAERLAKLILGYLIVALLIGATGIIYINTSQEILQESIGEKSASKKTPQ